MQKVLGAVFLIYEEIIIIYEATIRNKHIWF